MVITCRHLLFLTALAAGVFASSASAQQPSDLSRKELDQRLYKLVAESINLGASTFNGGNLDGCYQFYLGTLLSVRALLDHRPALQRTIDERITKAKGQGSAEDRARTLRDAMDACYKALGNDVRLPVAKNAGPPTEEPKKDDGKKTLYDRLGGEKVIAAVVDDFVKRAAGNPKVNFLRKGTPAEVKMDPGGMEMLKKQLVEMIGEAAGGPQRYNGLTMEFIHRRMGITDAEFDALAGDLKAALDSFKVPAAEQQEVLAIIGSTRAAIVEEKKR